MKRATWLALLLAVPLLADAAALMHVKWEGLAVVTGHTVSIAMPGGAVITGKATSVEADALVVDLGNAESALKSYDRVLQLARERKDHFSEAGALSNIGYVYLNLGDKRRSLEYLNKALPIFAEIGRASCRERV